MFEVFGHIFCCIQSRRGSSEQDGAFSLFSLCLFRVVLNMRYSDEMATEGIFSNHQDPVAKAFRNSCPDFNLNFRQFKSPVFSLLVLNET